jgi:two-component system NtrC family response regulator
MARGRVIMPSHFPQMAASATTPGAGLIDAELLSMPFHQAVGMLEKKLIENAIRLTAGNKTEAANRLMINRRLLYQKINEHQIKD